MSDLELRRRIALLHERGVEIGLADGPAVKDLCDIVGDCDLYELKRLVDLAVEDHNAAILSGHDDAKLLTAYRP